MKSYQQIVGDGTTDRALSYPRFEVRTDARNSHGEMLEGYGENIVSVHEDENAAESALENAKAFALLGHNHAQVWKVKDEDNADGGASITW